MGIEKQNDMKKKIVLWGNDEKDAKILLALELKAAENKVNIYTFGQDIVSEAFYNEMMDNWRTGKDVAFPEGHETIIRELSVTDDLLPETIKVQRTDLISRAKAEWHFVVLSSKLYDLYNGELADLKERIDKLVEFDGGIWEEVKGFWGKISEQARERNLFRDHANRLRDETNKLFTQLKEFKTKANEALSKVSKENVASFTERLDSVKTKVGEGMSLNPLFEELKKIQREFKDTEFTRNDRNKVWKRIDDAFKTVKEKKYGKNPEAQQQGAVSRVEKRYQGLMSAIGKMEQSINRDKKEIDFQNNRAGSSMGQLEMQLREAKSMMVQERINSKQEKLNEMLKTKEDLLKRVEKEKQRAAKREEKKEIEKKKEEVKQKLKSEITTSELSEEEAAKLEKAAAMINKKPKKKAKAKDGERTEHTVVTSAAEAPAEEVKAAAGEEKVEKSEAAVEKVKAATGEEKVEKSESPAEEVKAVTGEEKVEKSEAPAAEMKAVTGEEKAEKSEAATEEVEAPEVKQSILATAAAVVTEAVEDVVDTAKAAKKVVTDKVEEVTKDKADAAESVAADATESTAKETLAKGGLMAAAVAMGSKLVKEASEKLDDFSEATGLDETIDKAKETLAETKEAISDKVDDAKEKVTEMKENAKEEITEAKEEAEEKKAGLGDALKKGGLLGAAVALGSKVMDTVSDKVEDVAESLGVDDTLDKAKAKLSEAKEAVQEKVGEVKEAVEGKQADVSEESVDSVADRVRKEAKASGEEE